MPEVIYLLQPDGVVEELQAQTATLYKYIDGETDPATVTPSDVNFDPLVISFNGVADGRGFSLLSALRQSAGFSGRIYAGGLLNPDQLSFAFQCGFDGVLVSPDRWESYGADCWQSSLNPMVDLSYSLTGSQSVQSIWQQRHATDQ